MRRFSSATSHAASATFMEKPQDEPSKLDEAPFITPEDGDLWQDSPAPISQADVLAIPIPLNIGMSDSEQEDIRWQALSSHLGFERTDQDVPLGFEDFEWGHVFPADRETIATAIEPSVVRGDDLQEAIDDMYSKMF